MIATRHFVLLFAQTGPDGFQLLNGQRTKRRVSAGASERDQGIAGRIARRQRHVKLAVVPEDFDGVAVHDDFELDAAVERRQRLRLTVARDLLVGDVVGHRQILKRKDD